jgi:ankyrin repeat protein
MDTDVLFPEAVAAIDTGDLKALEELLEKSPHLASTRYSYPTEGYFKNPYLLWHVADNPIRIERLPANIVEITRFLVQLVKQLEADAQFQLDYTLGLVATGRIPKECGVQIEMIDLLIDAGAKPGDGLGALAHGNTEAAKHLLKHGGQLTLPAAACLEMTDEVKKLAASADAEELVTALTAAAFYGKAEMISLLLGMGAEPNGYPKDGTGFHSHATPLHQAISSGSLDAVRILVDAGADLNLKDKIYGGTPLDWAEHMQKEEGFDNEKKKSFASITNYLRNRET